jgi:hypothetical protein
MWPRLSLRQLPSRSAAGRVLGSNRAGRRNGEACCRPHPRCRRRYPIDNSRCTRPWRDRRPALLHWHSLARRVCPRCGVVRLVRRNRNVQEMDGRRSVAAGTARPATRRVGFPISRAGSFPGKTERARLGGAHALEGRSDSRRRSARAWARHLRERTPPVWSGHRSSLVCNIRA